MCVRGDVSWFLAMPGAGSTLPLMLLNTFEAAERLRIAPATLRRLIKSGELRAYQVARALRIDPADLEAFLRARTVL